MNFIEKKNPQEKDLWENNGKFMAESHKNWSHVLKYIMMIPQEKK